MAVDFSELWKKARTATDEAESVRALARILSSKDGRTFVLELESSEAELCIEILDYGLAEHKFHAGEKQAFFFTLMGLAGKHARLPDSMVITDKIEFSASGQPLTSGGFADIRQGEYKGCPVAVKTLRVAPTDNFDKIRRQFCKEVVLWNSLSHPNILRLVGVLGGIGKSQFATVSEWMLHGNIMGYIKKNATNRLELLHGAAQGLKYLHDANLIHRDLKGANILMTNDRPPKACLADFGFTTMVSDPQNPMSSSPTLEGGTLTFMAPELLAPSKFGLKSAVPTQEGDIYAFGLVILQVLTGEPPFQNIRPPEIGFHVAIGGRPGKPPHAEALGISDSLWKLIERCWDGEIKRRPRIREVVMGVSDAAANWHTDMLPGVMKRGEDSVGENSEEGKHVGIFEPYQSDDELVIDSGTGASQPKKTYTAPLNETNADFNQLWKKVRTATDEAEPVLTLSRMLSSKDGRMFILDLERQETELCIEILDHGLGEHMLCAAEKQVFFSTLMRLAGKHARLPDSMVITDEIECSASGQPLTSGGFADIKQGEYKGCAVAVKTLRIAQTDNLDKIRRQFCKEVVLWNSLSHPNILKLVGVLGGIGQYQFATVSEWMVHGNIMEYIGKYATNRLELLHGAAQGLKYLHDANLTHGDLKGANILMTNDTPPKACLADFGFTTMVSDPQNPMSSSLTLEGGTLTFMAPELLAPSKFGLKSAVPTQPGDVYAFGLVILQVLTGRKPFRDMSPPELAHHVSSGLRPERPANAEAIGISDHSWRLIQKCWDGERMQRPQIQEVVAGVGDAAAKWHTDMPPGVTEREGSVEEESCELRHVGIFEPYRSDDEPVADSGTGTSQLRNTHAASTQPSEVEAHAPPVALPLRRHKGFKRFLRTIFGHTSRH